MHLTVIVAPNVHAGGDKKLTESDIQACQLERNSCMQTQKPQSIQWAMRPWLPSRKSMEPTKSHEFDVSCAALLGICMHRQPRAVNKHQLHYQLTDGWSRRTYFEFRSLTHSVRNRSTCFEFRLQTRGDRVIGDIEHPSSSAW